MTHLYPRNPAGSRREVVKLKAIAHRALDRARKGEKVKPEVIDWALEMVGDMPSQPKPFEVVA